MNAVMTNSVHQKQRQKQSIQLLRYTQKSMNSPAVGFCQAVSSRFVQMIIWNHLREMRSHRRTVMLKVKANWRYVPGCVVPMSAAYDVDVLSNGVIKWVLVLAVADDVRDGSAKQNIKHLIGRRALRSASTSRLVIPPIKLSTVGSRAFPVAAAQVWNGLPEAVISSYSLLSFRRQLKTHLFQLSHPHLILWLLIRHRYSGPCSNIVI